MMCFMDMTFCSDSERHCANTECRRYFGPEQRAASERWWEGMKGPVPVAFGDYWDSCTRRVEKTQ